MICTNSLSPKIWTQICWCLNPVHSTAPSSDQAAEWAGGPWEQTPCCFSEYPITSLLHEPLGFPLCGGGVSLVPLQWHWVRPLGLKSSLCYFLAVNVFGQVTQGLSFLILKMGVYLGTGHWVWHRVLATIIMWRLPLPLQLVPSGFWGFIFWGQRTRLSGRAAALLCLWFFDHSWIS